MKEKLKVLYKDEIKCPYCGETNTYVYQMGKAYIWGGSFDNIIYRCKCDDCSRNFIKHRTFYAVCGGERK